MTHDDAIRIFERALSLVDTGVEHYRASKGITAQYETAKGLRKEFKTAVRYLKQQHVIISGSTDITLTLPGDE